MLGLVETKERSPRQTQYLEILGGNNFCNFLKISSKANFSVGAFWYKIFDMSPVSAMCFMNCRRTHLAFFSPGFLRVYRLLLLQWRGRSEDELQINFCFNPFCVFLTEHKKLSNLHRGDSGLFLTDLNVGSSVSRRPHLTRAFLLHHPLMEGRSKGTLRDWPQNPEIFPKEGDSYFS